MASFERLKVSDVIKPSAATSDTAMLKSLKTWSLLTPPLVDEGYRVSDLYMRDKHGNTPLAIAAGVGARHEVEFLLSQGANPNSRNYRGNSVIACATSFLSKAQNTGQEERYARILSCVVLLVDHGAKLMANSYDEYYVRPKHLRGFARNTILTSLLAGEDRNNGSENSKRSQKIRHSSGLDVLLEEPEIDALETFANDSKSYLSSAMAKIRGTKKRKAKHARAGQGIWNSLLRRQYSANNINESSSRTVEVDGISRVRDTFDQLGRFGRPAELSSNRELFELDGSNGKVESEGNDACHSHTALCVPLVDIENNKGDSESLVDHEVQRQEPAQHQCMLLEPQVQHSLGHHIGRDVMPDWRRQSFGWQKQDGLVGSPIPQLGEISKSQDELASHSFSGIAEPQGPMSYAKGKALAPQASKNLGRPFGDQEHPEAYHRPTKRQKRHHEVLSNHQGQNPSFKSVSLNTSLMPAPLFAPSTHSRSQNPMESIPTPSNRPSQHDNSTRAINCISTSRSALGLPPEIRCVSSSFSGTPSPWSAACHIPTATSASPLETDLSSSEATGYCLGIWLRGEIRCWELDCSQMTIGEFQM